MSPREKEGVWRWGIVDRGEETHYPSVHRVVAEVEDRVSLMTSEKGGGRVVMDHHGGNKLRWGRKPLKLVQERRRKSKAP